MDGRRFVLTFVYGSSVLCALLTVVGTALLDSLTFAGAVPSDNDRLHTMVLSLGVGGLCLLALGVAALLRLPSTLLWVCVGGVAFSAVMAYWAFGAMQVAPPDDYPDPWWTGLRDALVVFTDWPLLLCLVLAPLVPATVRENGHPTLRMEVPR